MKNSSSFNLSNKNILITGSAGRIGSEVAKAALEANAFVIITDIKETKLEKVYKKLSNLYPDKVLSFCADLSSQKGIEYLINNALLKINKIDAAVHCAYPTSEGWGEGFENLKSENLYQDLSMQLGGAIMFSQSIMRCFTKQKSGHLIHISSIQGVQAPKFEHYVGTGMSSPIEYTAIKSGIIAITKWLAKYHHSQGIRVNCVSPGGILDSQPESFLNRYRNDCTNIGMLSPKDVASAIVFLLSPASIAINGHNLIVDDGWTL